MEEIKAVHGKDAFRSESVKDFFDLHPELERKRKEGNGKRKDEDEENFKCNLKLF